MFGLKIFVRVQIFWRGPLCPRTISAFQCLRVLLTQCNQIEHNIRHLVRSLVKVEGSSYRYSYIDWAIYTCEHGEVSDLVFNAVNWNLKNKFQPWLCIFSILFCPNNIWQVPGLRGFGKTWKRRRVVVLVKRATGQFEVWPTLCDIPLPS